MSREKGEEVGDEEITPTSSPPTPPSPLPVSVGPGNSKYYFSSSSPSVSPPFSAHNSAENLPHIARLPQEEQEYSSIKGVGTTAFAAPSAFSLDASPQLGGQYHSSSSSSPQGSDCLRELVEWFILRCCSCCSWNLNSTLSSSKPHQS